MKIKLSESQKDALYRAANNAMTQIVHNRRKHNEAWKEAFTTDHKATIRALTDKGLLEDGVLTKEGVEAAKDIYTETISNTGKSWGAEVGEAVKRRDDREAKAAQERKEWQEYLETLPVPEGYQAPLGYSPLNIEWRATEFAYAPTIQISDKNAPFMEPDRYKAPSWEMSFSTGSGMDAEAVRIFKQALDMAQTIMTTLEIRYADVEVKSL